MPRAAAEVTLYPHELSGGMRQRVMIALALAGRPGLLFADEPTTALDVTVQRGILELLDELRRETGMAIVLVTHDLAVVQSTADTIAVMYAGWWSSADPRPEVLARPAHPYTAALIGARPRPSAARGDWRPFPGRAPALGERPTAVRSRRAARWRRTSAARHHHPRGRVAAQSACFRWQELLS